MQLCDAATNLCGSSRSGASIPFLDYFASVHLGESVCGEAQRLHDRVIVEDVSRSPIFLNKPSLAVLEAAGVRAVQSTP